MDKIFKWTERHEPWGMLVVALTLFALIMTPVTILVFSLNTSADNHPERAINRACLGHKGVSRISDTDRLVVCRDGRVERY